MRANVILIRIMRSAVVKYLVKMFNFENYRGFIGLTSGKTWLTKKLGLYFDLEREFRMREGIGERLGK